MVNSRVSLLASVRTMISSIAVRRIIFFSVGGQRSLCQISAKFSLIKRIRASSSETTSSASHTGWKGVLSLSGFPPAFRSSGVPTRPPPNDSWHLLRRIVQTPSLPRTPVARVCCTRQRAVRRPLRSIPQWPSDWLPPQNARSLLRARHSAYGPPKHRQSRCSTARHRHSLPCRGNARWCLCHPSSAREACAHNAHSGEAPPEGPARHESPPWTRHFASSLSSAASFVGSLRRWPSQYSPRDDRG